MLAKGLQPMMLAQIAEAVAARKLPPVEQWSPDNVDDSHMRIAADGTWFHDGSPINRQAMVRAFSGLLVRDESGRHWLISPFEMLSIEVEDALYPHPDVATGAVVAKPDEKWGETPCAFIELKDGAEAPSEAEIIEFCQANMARYKCPRHVRFVELPKTSTGKVQKFILREKAKAL